MSSTKDDVSERTDYYCKVCWQYQSTPHKHMKEPWFTISRVATVVIGITVVVVYMAWVAVLISKATFLAPCTGWRPDAPVYRRLPDGSYVQEERWKCVEK